MSCLVKGCILSPDVDIIFHNLCGKDPAVFGRQFTAHNSGGEVPQGSRRTSAAHQPVTGRGHARNKTALFGTLQLGLATWPE